MNPKIMKLLTLITTVVLAVFSTIPAHAQKRDQPTDEPLEKLKPFLETYCIDCHDEAERKAGLSLESLTLDLANEDGAKTWIRVFDKIAAGEMPPKKKGQPTQAERDATTKLLHDELHAASLAQQQKRGRVIVRRLNSTEYENTIRDLLGTQVKLKEMLPEDSSVAGFDNVSTALDLSAKHFLMYHKAAERAIESTVPVCPPTAFSDQRTGKDMVVGTLKKRLLEIGKIEGDALIIYKEIGGFARCETPPVPMAGRYRIQLKAAAAGGGGGPIPVGYFTRELRDTQPSVFKELHYIQPGEPKVYEFDWELGLGQSFGVNVLWPGKINTRRGKEPKDDYPGLGLRVEWLKIEGPTDAFPAPAYATLFDGVPLKPRSVAEAMAENKPLPMIQANRRLTQWHEDPLEPVSENPKADAERLIRSFVQRAFRRPVSEETQGLYVQAVEAKLDAGYRFYDAMTFGYKFILSSPDFLFLVNPGAPDAEGNLASTKLDDYSLAERLAYFLTSTAPDAELLALAQQGELSKPSVLRAETERLLNSPRGHRFTENFTGQWLDLRKIEDTQPDTKLYGDFDKVLEWAMPRETMLFFEEVLKHDLPLTDFVHSDWTILNERLATLYGIKGIVGGEFRKVKLPPDARRGGVMTQASVLKVTADGAHTSPVLRGKWVLERILGKPPQPPPPNIPAVEPDTRGATTIRQQLDKPRNTAACASCHIHIDPPGFALETYDPIGNWRDFYRIAVAPDENSQPIRLYGKAPVFRGLDVEKGGKTPDGRDFKDIDEYKAILLEDKDQLARNLAKKLITYATGGEIQFADREVVEQIVSRAREKHYGFRSLLHEVVQSRVFLNK